MAIQFPQFDPVALSIGPIDLRWYALSYMAGFIAGWQTLKYYLRKFRAPHLTRDHVDDLLTWIIIGVILGGRMGYVLFYNLPYYADNPIDALKIWQGGMAFHGGLIGVILAMIGFAWKNNIPFWELADRVAVVTPIGLFFGRIANFINGELYGRATDFSWGMIFRAGDVPRHPSQLYQAVTEGFILFTILLICLHIKSIREKIGVISGLFLAGYGFMRFFTEYTREPDAHIGLLILELSMGQLLCLPMVLAGLIIVYFCHKRHPEFISGSQ